MNNASKNDCIKNCVKPTRLTSNINVRTNLSTFAKVKAEWDKWFACVDKCKGKNANKTQKGGKRNKTRRQSRRKN